MQIKMKDKEFKKLKDEYSAKKIIEMHVKSEIIKSEELCYPDFSFGVSPLTVQLLFLHR